MPIQKMGSKTIPYQPFSKMENIFHKMEYGLDGSCQFYLIFSKLCNWHNR